MIIDEASQILEPYLTFLWKACNRKILIGDHKQLPAVVIQDSKNCVITEPLLTNIGLQSTSHALFDRLLRRTKENGWTHAYGLLSRQGRMHKDLLEFPNKQFYENELKVPFEWQNEKLQWQKTDIPSHQIISTHRLALFHIEPEDIKSTFSKTSFEEAKQTVDLLHSIYQMYKTNGRAFDHNSVGIITPFRAQIVLIEQLIKSLGINELEKTTVDTVERYQGGQRAIIILCFSVQSLNRVSQIQSLTTDQLVDRKLNVALTRARQQLFLVGNVKILSKAPHLKELVQYCNLNKMIYQNNLKYEF